MMEENVRYEIRGDRSTMKWMPPIFAAISAFFVIAYGPKDGYLFEIALMTPVLVLYTALSEFVFHRLTYLILHENRLDIRRDSWGLKKYPYLSRRKWKIPYSRIISIERRDGAICITYQAPEDGAETTPIATVEIEPRQLEAVHTDITARLVISTPQRDAWALSAVH